MQKIIQVYILGSIKIGLIIEIIVGKLLLYNHYSSNYNLFGESAGHFEIIDIANFLLQMYTVQVLYLMS